MVKWFRNKITLGIIVGAVILHLFGILLVFTSNLTPFTKNYIGCDFWSLVQAGMDLRHGAGIYVPDDIHPIIWGPIGFPFVLPPWIAYVTGVPLSFFNPVAAQVIFSLLLETCLVGVAIFCWRMAGEGFRGSLAAALCLVAAPQLTVLHQGQTDTFICLGATLLLWGITQGGKFSRNIGLGLLIGIKPLGLFTILPMLFNRRTRIATIIVMSIFFVLLTSALIYTIQANPGIIDSHFYLFTSIKPGELAFNLEIKRPQYDFVFQFFKFLIIGRSGAVGPLNNFLAVDQGPMNLLRVLGLPWVYFSAFFLALALYFTWRFRYNPIANLVSVWVLLSLTTLPVVWDTYFLLVLPVAAYLTNKRKNILPLVAALFMLLPNLRWIEDKTAVLAYPLPPAYLPMILVNLIVRASALGWLTAMTWNVIHVDYLKLKDKNHSL